MVVFLGVANDDTEKDALWMAEKIVRLRIHGDAQGKMNLSLLDIQGELLVISQFTLFADTSKGRRPSFVHAAEPKKGETLYERCVQALRSYGVPVYTGRFGEMMEVDLLNDGPVTILFDSKK
jgi:D-tyrosyl-tRNA(Tyr) deacylase